MWVREARRTTGAGSQRCVACGGVETASVPDRRVTVSALRAGVVGAIAAAAAVIVVMPAFYPLARVFDPSAGGDGNEGLATELALGLIGGVLLSPIAAVIGAFIGRRIHDRRLEVKVVGAVFAVAVIVAVSLFVALNGGLIDESGSISSLHFVTTLGAIAAAVAVSIFAALRGAISGE